MRENVRSPFLPIAFAVLVGYLTLFYQLTALPFFGADEPRYARIGEEMLASGDYVTPHLEGKPWLEKPPLLFWGEALSFRLLGTGEAPARIPSVLLALLGSLALSFVVLRTTDPRRGWLAFLVLLTTPLYLVFARAASTDMPLTGTLTAALAFSFLAELERRPGWAAAAGISLGLALLAKGPVALVLVSMILFTHFLVSGRIGWRPVDALLALGLTIAVALPWYWLAWLENGDTFLITFFVNHHLARYATDLHHHEGPFWYYLPILLFGLFPWTFFLWSSFRRWWSRFSDRSTEARLRNFLWIWALVPIGFFSLSSSKLAGYILPVVPPLAALVALEWERYFTQELPTYRSLKTLVALLTAFSVILIAVLVFGFHFRYGAISSGLVVSIPVALTALLAWRQFRKRRVQVLFVILAGGTALTMALLYRQASPVVARFHSTRDLIRVAQPLVSPENPLVFYRFFHHTARYYANFETTRASIESPHELADHVRRHPADRYILLTKEEGWKDISAAVETRLVSSAGDLYLIEIRGDPAGWHD